MPKNPLHRSNVATEPYHVITKPIGAICNLDCEYCYYLEKETLYPETTDFKMTDEVLRKFTRQYLSQPGDEITFTWQGGEPTLMGLDFFRRAVTLQKEYNTEGKTIRNSLQTNGVKLDNNWAEFFQDHDFLVGLSIDGPAHVHNKYRYFKGGQGSFDAVKAGLDTLKENGVEFNVLGCVNDYSARYPYEIYDFYTNEVGTRYWQFIPIVERSPGSNGGDVSLASHSVDAEQYGDFLIQIFNRWVRNDIGTISVQIFDIVFRVYLGMKAGLCLFDKTCGNALAIEHNGDLYSCDHYVETEYHIGNVATSTLNEMVATPFQRQFGQDKESRLPAYCQNCEVQFLCNGGCPKNRFITTPDGEPGLNYLCAGYKKFFHYVDPYMRFIAQQYNAGAPPEQMMEYIRSHPDEFVGDISRNDPCYCGSGKKYKKCCIN